MKALHTLLLVVTLTLAATFNAQAGPSIASWTPCDVISSPLGTSLSDVQHALVSKGVAGEQSQGSAAQGTYAMTYNDEAQKNTVQLTFDTQNKLDAASTWYTATTAAKATDMFKSIMSRIEKQGGQRADMGSLDLNDGSVTYSVDYGAGDVRTVTVGRNADEPNVIWLVVSR